MPTVAEVMNKAARACRATAPTSWITATTLTYLDLKDHLADTVDELLDRVDWPDPITKDATITGTGAETYSLPSDFKRLTRDDFTVYETTTTRRGAIPVTSNSDWTFLRDVGSASGNRYYRTSGDDSNGYEMSFFQSLSSGDSVTVSYVSKNWLSIGGVEGDTWSDASAVLLLPRNLIELGVVWRFRRAKGLPYADRMADYEAKLARAANDKRQRQTICFGERPTVSANPYDWMQPPDVIPTA